jgi:hypothetical protein
MCPVCRDQKKQEKAAHIKRMTAKRQMEKVFRKEAPSEPSQQELDEWASKFKFKREE